MQLPCQVSPAWQQSQTTAPTNLQVTFMPTGTIRLSWQPISYTVDGGYYELSYTTSITGNYTILGITKDKAASYYDLSSLRARSRLYFRIRTYTPPHSSQANALWSDYASVTAESKRNVYLPVIQ